ncbi:hypothetical protein MPTK1_1g10620 [Marchantia polymorpha subsp. ruderalis]|uniref:Uncharacterized protein n=2 Tax=Marchantia polymorpha TaxID=3197 RepID=A0AAF6ANQ2_MARPO|nr:hypothetical protein MARPO_0014s0165 [Marchantia polymorpha]BBM98072.1 hypothetical protein Mp_1g10620 [Marchantia polymorpha subsp. ruderalis]|eukprot:PTQ45654.1 hypothetical protein MARPO_0014s0165 [Marchantia polymorpha]
MSLWGFDGGENTLTTWSSLGQFDDMVWNEFGENGDHVVPHPNGNQNGTAWTSNGDHRKKLGSDGTFSCLSNRDSPASKGGSDSCTETSESDQLDEDKDESKGEEVPMEDMLPGGSWSDLGSVVDLPLESQPFDSGPLQEARSRADISECEEELKDQRVRMLSEDVQLFIGEEDGSMVTDPFSLTEVGSQSGGLEPFGDENTPSKGVSLLDLGWANIGNLDDMDKLFRNNDASFEPVMAGNADGLEWPSSSPNPVSNSETSLQFEKTPLGVEAVKPAVVKVEVDAAENKIQPTSCEESPTVRSSDKSQDTAGVKDLTSAVASPKSSSFQKSAPAQQPPARRPEKNDVVHEAKAHRARRHAANRKRSEERFKRGACYRKLSPGPPYAVNTHGDMMQLPIRMLGQPSHLQPGPSPSALQVYAQPPGLISMSPAYQLPPNLPYIQVGYPLHHMPMMSPCPAKPISHMQYPQPMFVDLQPPNIHSQKPSNQHGTPIPSPLAPKVPFQTPGPIEQQQQHPVPVRPSFDASCRPPTCSPSMTPQEKLEKLRWRQQMQAIIAVEQQQKQLLASQNGGAIEPPIYHRPQHTTSQNLAPGRLSTESSDGRLKSVMDTEHKTLVPAGGDIPATTSGENEDSSLEGSVLCQLEMTISQLDIKTRLVIRNALYRLARSARKRRAAGGENGCSSQSSGERTSGCNGVESSTASDSPSCRGSRATSMSEVETETNPIDRTIAKLLFCKPPPQYIPGPMYITEKSPYPGVPQLPAGVPNAPWGWSSAAVPPNNGVGPPGLPPVSTSLPWGGTYDERSTLAPAWAPPPVMNGYRTPVLTGYRVDPRFGTNTPVSKLRDNVAGLNFASASKSEHKEESSMSPVPSLQTESCSSAGLVVRNHVRVSNSSVSGANCHAMVKPQDVELNTDACKTTMEILGDTPPLSSTAFVPDRIPPRATASVGVQEASLGSQFKSANDSEQVFAQGNGTPCINDDPVQFLSSTLPDEAGIIDQKPVLESLSFPTGRLDVVSHSKEGILEGLR